VCAESRVTPREVSDFAKKALDPTLFRRACESPAKVLLPFEPFPFGLWCSIAQAARLLNRDDWDLRRNVRRGRELAVRLGDAGSQRVVFVVAVRTKRAKRRKK
jgi:hypothetical protein